MVVGQKHVVPNESVVGAELDGEAVLLNVDTGVYFGLDALATRIWNLITQGATEDQIVNHLLEEYEAERAQLSADTAEFLELLVAKGLARISEE
jgi:hypothetical protein